MNNLDHGLQIVVAACQVILFLWGFVWSTYKILRRMEENRRIAIEDRRQTHETLERQNKVLKEQSTELAQQTNDLRNLKETSNLRLDKQDTVLQQHTEDLREVRQTVEGVKDRLTHIEDFMHREVGNGFTVPPTT